MPHPPPPGRKSIEQLTDEELLCLAQGGSSPAFAHLVDRYGGRLLRLLERRTGNVHDAEDLLQATFARAYAAMDRYKPAWRVSTWLFTIALRLAASHFRRRRGASLDDAPPAVTDRDPHADLVAREEAQGLWRLAREQLSEDQFTALWLRYVEEMPVVDVARALGKTRTHAKVILFRARSRLGKALARMGRGAGSRPAGLPPSLRRAEEAV